MNPTIKTNLQTLFEIGSLEKQSFYMVGGSVRDRTLEKECSDWDFAVPNAPKTAGLFANKTGHPLVPLDETPGHETYRVVVERDLYFDFTTLQGKTIQEDLAQRDFTINAMAIPLIDFIADKPNVIDPFKGKFDLENKIIRVVSSLALEEDPLRLLRAFRFASTLEFDIEPKTLEHIQTHRVLLGKVAHERITYELLLLLGAPRSPLGLMDSTRLIDVLFSGISELRKTSGHQPGMTLWDDTLNAFNQLEDLLLKPDRFLEEHTQWIKDYISKDNRYALLKWSVLMRSLMSDPAFDATESLKEFRLSNTAIQFIYRTLKFSEIVLSGSRSTGGGFREDSTVYQFNHRSGNTMTSSLLLALAVQLGNQEDIKYFIPLINRILNFHIEKYLPARDRPSLMNGDILKHKFQLTPSPRFRFILEKVEEARVLGIIQTSEEAEQLAKELITSPMELRE
jgi:poly(A) polymerase/tRNA nucleotidyltransferase (CCA-adding enzyme)